MSHPARSGSPAAANADLTVDPGAVDEAVLAPGDLFCSLACLRYGTTDAPPRWRAAADLHAGDPGIVDRSIWAWPPRPTPKRSRRTSPPIRAWSPPPAGRSAGTRSPT
nr:hypothetical protein [Tsukamurella pulmonis]